MTRTPDLLDLLGDRLPTPPEGMVLGWRSTRPDLRSRDGFRWPWPGGWAEAPDDGRDLTGDHPAQACPSRTLGGLCLAKTWTGARSGGIPADEGLAVEWEPHFTVDPDLGRLTEWTPKPRFDGWIESGWNDQLAYSGGMAVPGNVGACLTDVTPLTQPVAAKGRRLWKPSAEIVAECLEQVR